MLQSAIGPNIGHAIVHHFGEGAATWGRAITPSIAHAVQGNRKLTIDYSLVHPETAFETVSSVAMLPHVLNDPGFACTSKARYSAVALADMKRLRRPSFAAMQVPTPYL